MAIKGSKSKNVAAKGTKGNPTRTKTKTQRISPKDISKFKNEVTKQKSKAILTATAKYNKYTNTGSVVSAGGREYTKSINIASKVGQKLKPTIKISTNKKSKLKYRQISGTSKVVKQLGRY